MRRPRSTGCSAGRSGCRSSRWTHWTHPAASPTSRPSSKRRCARVRKSPASSLSFARRGRTRHSPRNSRSPPTSPRAQIATSAIPRGTRTPHIRSASRCRSRCSSGSTPRATLRKRTIASSNSPRRCAIQGPASRRTSACRSRPRMPRCGRCCSFAISCCRPRARPTVWPPAATRSADFPRSTCSPPAPRCSPRKASTPMHSPPPPRRDPPSRGPPACRSPRSSPELPVSKPAIARVTVAAASLTMLAFAASCGGTSDAAATAAAQKPSAFTVTDVQRAKLKIVTLATEKFRPTLEVTGTVAFNGDKSTQVISPVSGPVSRIVANLGANVTAGEAVAPAASPDFAADVATYRKAETAVRNTARLLKLDEQLFANDALARRELDQARSDNAGAEADRDAAMIALRSLGLDDATITAIRDGQRTAPVQGTIVAPIPGTVVEKLINPGQLLTAGTTPAFTVADLSSMWVIASVYATDIPLVTSGVPVDIMTDASTKSIRGVVDYVAPIVDPGTKATTVRIVAENPGQLLKRDMLVRVASVLRDDDNLPFVFVANAEGAFVRRRVTLGYRVADRFEVLTGLAAGEKVVADGALFLQFAKNQ